MTAFILKLIAMSTMVIDHVGHYFLNDNYCIRAIGRMAFITYAFLIAESYYHLKKKPERLKAHGIKLFLLSLISEIPYDICARGKWFDPSKQNVVFLLWLGFLTLILIGSWKKKTEQRRVLFLFGCGIIVAAAAVTTWALRTEYKVAGLVLIVLFALYLEKENNWAPQRRWPALTGVIVIYLLLHFWTRTSFGDVPKILSLAQKESYRIIGSLLATIPLAFYNRERGYDSKEFRWFYSLFYPLQYILFAIAINVIK